MNKNHQHVSLNQLIRENRDLRIQLEQIEKKYKLFADNVSDVIWIFDFVSERLTYISPSIRNLTGHTPEQALELRWEDIVIPEHQEKFRQFMDSVLSIIHKFKNKQDKPFELEMGHRHKSGKTVWVELKARFLFDEMGEPYLILGVTREITDRKIAEEKLLETYLHLEEMVEQRTAHLNEANIALKVLLEKRDQDKAEIEEKVIKDLKNLIFPTLEKLKKICRNEQQQAYLNILENNIDDSNSPLMKNPSLKFLNLTPMETQVANFIILGKTNKEISGFLYLSLRTVEFHRRNIRNKLGIKNKKINLRTYLLSIQKSEI